MIGAGKYDVPCERTLLETRAQAVILIVLGGDKGSGFSVSAVGGAVGSTIEQLPAILRSCADEIEKDVATTKKQ